MEINNQSKMEEDDEKEEDIGEVKRSEEKER